MRLYCYFGIALVFFAGSCQCDRTESQARAYSARTGPVIYAADLVELEDVRDFYKRVFGQDQYSTQWSELDKFRTGEVISSRVPYQDTWYPERTGGTNLEGALTRYDQAFAGGQSKAAKWEQENHNRLQPNWYGHCNGTGVTVSRYQNPLKSVTRPKGCQAGTAGCVEFSPGDIRAMLSEINMNSIAKFISGNRCRLPDGDIKMRPPERSNPQVMDECDDVNPGSFHVGLVNFLGRKKQPLIFDEHQDEEVWNYPIYAYDYTVEGPWTEDQAVNALRNSIVVNGASAFPAFNGWIFNPKARSWLHINMNISYRDATFDTVGAGTKPEAKRISYEYIIELDDAGQVVGGEWMGASRNFHPDFLWMAFEPAEPTGDNSRGNPYLSNAEVIKLWAESVGLNPEDPFHDKPNNPNDVRFFPATDIKWGEVTGFYHMLLDGRATGTAFLGKKTHLRLETQESLKTDASVEIQLNGQALPAGNIQDGKLDVIFDSPPGINLLSLRWTSSKVDSGELNWDFRYYAM
ncbi:MAG: hypothetical protein NTX25_04730 [Proteobacteria bacterium]|nr:hypothetical protein [Pseudomonadota bacterium]